MGTLTRRLFQAGSHPNRLRTSLTSYLGGVCSPRPTLLLTAGPSSPPPPAHRSQTCTEQRIPTFFTQLMLGDFWAQWGGKDR